MPAVKFLSPDFCVESDTSVAASAYWLMTWQCSGSWGIFVACVTWSWHPPPHLSSRHITNSVFSQEGQIDLTLLPLSSSIWSWPLKLIVKDFYLKQKLSTKIAYNHITKLVPSRQITQYTIVHSFELFLSTSFVCVSHNIQYNITQELTLNIFCRFKNKTKDKKFFHKLFMPLIQNESNTDKFNFIMQNRKIHIIQLIFFLLQGSKILHTFFSGQHDETYTYITGGRCK